MSRLQYFIGSEVHFCSTCDSTVTFSLTKRVAIKVGTYPLILSVWIQPTIHSFDNITPKKRSCKRKTKLGTTKDFKTENLSLNTVIIPKRSRCLTFNLPFQKMTQVETP